MPLRSGGGRGSDMEKLLCGLDFDIAKAYGNAPVSRLCLTPSLPPPVRVAGLQQLLRLFLAKLWFLRMQPHILGRRPTLVIGLPVRIGWAA